MATNTYSYGSLGERFGVGNATTKSSLDLSRIKNDANRWTLQQLVTDPDNDANFALNVASVTGTTGTFSGDFTVDTDTLFVDVSADRVGVNTASPQVDFHVDNDSTNGVARISTSHSSSYAQLQLVNQSGNYWYQTLVQSDNSYRLYNGSDRLIVDTDGHLGLGGTPTSNGTGSTVLNVNSSSGGATIHLTNSTTGATNSDGALIVQSGSDLLLINRESGNLKLRTADTNRVTISATGLDVNGVANGNSAFKVTNAAGNKTSEFEIDGSGNGAMKVRASNGIEKISLSSYENSHISAGYNFGFGTMSPQALLHTSAGGSNISSVTGNTQAIFANTAAAGSVSRVLILAGTGSGYSVLDFADTTRGSATDNGNITYNHADERMTFATDVGTTRIAVDSDGLKFGTDTASANALDDYEEGTWTPTIDASSSSPSSITYTTQGGCYQKVGNTIHISGYVYVAASGLSGGSGSIEIKGFPYTASSGYTVGYQSLSVGYATANGNFIEDTSTVRVRAQFTGTTQVQILGSNTDSWGSGVYEISVFGSYKIA